MRMPDCSPRGPSGPSLRSLSASTSPSEGPLQERRCLTVHLDQLLAGHRAGAPRDRAPARSRGCACVPQLTHGSDHAGTGAQCSQCDAVCCRLTVVLQPEDRIPAHLTTRTDARLLVMAHDEDGWCVALDGARMNCGIYETRPAICRRFVMDGPYCNAVRDEYVHERTRAIDLTLL